MLSRMHCMLHCLPVRSSDTFNNLLVDLLVLLEFYSLLSSLCSLQVPAAREAVQEQSYNATEEQV